MTRFLRMQAFGAVQCKCTDFVQQFAYIPFCGIKPFCFPSVRFLFIPLVLDKMRVRYDHTDDDTDTE